MSIQKHWRWCNRCDGLFYADASNNTCPGGGTHDPTGSGYYLAQTAPAAGAQDGWSWCRKCGQIAYSQAGAGHCSAGGGHDFSGSGAYSMLYQQPSGFSQQNWRWCNKCQSLFFGGRAGGICAAGGAHDSTGSGNYFLGYQVVGDGLFIAHQAAGATGELRLAVYQNGSFVDIRIPGGCTGTPSPVMFNGKLYIFYQGMSASRDLWYTIFDGTTFSDTIQAPNVGIYGSPQTQAFKGSTQSYIEIVLRDNSDANQPWIITYDLNAWGHYKDSDVTGSLCDPALFSINGPNNTPRMQTIYEDPDSPGTLKLNYYDGIATVMNCASSFAPAVIRYKGQLYLFHQGPNGNGQLNCQTITYSTANGHEETIPPPTFGPSNPLPGVSMSALPAPAILGDLLYVFHEGAGNSGELYYTTFDGKTWSGDHRAADIGVSAGCGVTPFHFDP